MNLSSSFPRIKAPETGRTAVQLTQGTDFCYPLYYFIPSISQDGRFLIHHRSDGQSVQLHRLDLHTGESVQITQATAPPEETHWRLWDAPAGRGVLDHRSVLNTIRNEVVYFDGNAVRIVDLESLQDRLFFELPTDRIAIGQNCVTADGSALVYIHHDRETYFQLADDWNLRHLCRGAELRVRNFDTGEDRLLVRMNSPIHHVLPHGPDQFLFCHPTTEQGILLTDLRGGWYSHLHTQDERGTQVCHFLSTPRGIAYEAWWSAPPARYAAGLYDPATHRKTEFLLPEEWGYTHTGADPEGLQWFFETTIPKKKSHELFFLEAVHEGNAVLHTLCGDWPTFGSGQKSHFHPRITSDRRWIMMVAGDPATRTNQIFLLDISDLPESRIAR